MSCKIIDIQGKRFTRLLVLSQAGKDKWGQATWLCQCDCGKKVVTTSSNLRTAHTLSCGCWRNEATGRANTKHGHTYRRVNGKISASREYRSWQGMKKRCLDVTHVYYKNYGGRGITICDNWITSFENFLSDMGARPVNTTLDRINNNGNYEPANCRWATYLQQASNKR